MPPVAAFAVQYLGAGPPTLWPSPLAVGPLVASLGGEAIGGAGGAQAPPAAGADRDHEHAWTLVAACAAGAQAWLVNDSAPQITEPSNSSITPSASVEQLSSVPALSHLLPPPLGPSLLSTIANTLASSRQIRPSRPPPTLTFRWTLSTILGHYFPHRYGQQMEGGVITYARGGTADAAVQAYHERIGEMRFSSGEEEEPGTPVDWEEDRAEGIRAATLSIAKRDDKMRWLLGGESQSDRGWVDCGTLSDQITPNRPQLGRYC